MFDASQHEAELDTFIGRRDTQRLKDEGDRREEELCAERLYEYSRQGP